MSYLSMSGLNLGLLLPSTTVIRPFGSTDIRRQITEETPGTPPSERKRKYDWRQHQDAPIRQGMVSRPGVGAGASWL